MNHARGAKEEEEDKFNNIKCGKGQRNESVRSGTRDASKHEMMILLFTSELAGIEFVYSNSPSHDDLIS